MRVIVALMTLLASFAASADWTYQEDTDAMTSKRTSYASLESNNSLNLDSPYKGRNHGHLMVGQHPKHGLSVMFQVQKGQIMCHSYSGCGVDVRFDDNPAVKFSANGSADNDPKVIFLSNASRFVTAASKAKRILVQVTMYHNGSSVLEFYSAKPLEWAKAKVTPPKKTGPTIKA